MDTARYNISEYIRDLSSRKAVPGGGSASALSGAIAISLGQMAGELTLGKEKYAEYADRISELLSGTNDLINKFLKLADEDADALLPLLKAYSLPKDIPENSGILEKSLIEASKPPMEILKSCCRAVELLEKLSKISSRVSISDVATGVAICRGVMMGAYMNIKVNTRLMADRKYAERLDKEGSKLIEEYAKRAEDLFWEIFKKNCIS